MLKRKNEESEESKESTHYVKRVALDAEAVERKDMQDDKQKTSVSLANTTESNQEGAASDDMQDDDNSNNTINVNSTTNNETPSSIPQPPPPSSASAPAPSDAIPATDSSESIQQQSQHGGPISSHRVQNDDPTYVHFRMLANISDTASIVGKGGESISKIKEQSNARVNVSENLKGVPERIISVRGPAEYVAKAFGLIIRTINNEPFDQPSNIDSKTYNLRLLFPHTVMGYIIGKKGSRFREIEENSAAALRANDQILPASTDRILNINGVADAIHIATYYVAQTVIEHKQQLAKAVYYNPANFNQPVLPTISMNHHNNGIGNNNGNNRQFNNNGGNYNPQNQPQQQPQQQQQNMMNPMLSNLYNQNPMKMLNNSNQGFPGMMNGMNMNGMGMGMNMGTGLQQNNSSVSSNTTPGETITGPDGKINQELFVPQKHIGLVIGRGGKNLKDIRQNTGCYVKVNDEVPGATDRKLTLIGNVYGIQNAILLINNKIENEKLRQQRDARD